MHVQKCVGVSGLLCRVHKFQVKGDFCGGQKLTEVVLKMVLLILLVIIGIEFHLCLSILSPRGW